MNRVWFVAMVMCMGGSPYRAGLRRDAARGKVYRIGELREGQLPPSNRLAEALRELGWVEGQNLKIERRGAQRREQLPALAAELVRLRVDVILTAGTPATVAAKEASRTIPIVFTLAGDPVETGLVASLARPGGNLTGFTLGLYDEKLVEILKETIPGLSRLAYAAPAGVPPTLFANMISAARTLGVQAYGISVQGPNGFDAFFAAAQRADAGAALVPNIAWFRPHLTRIGAAAAKEPSTRDRLRPGVRRRGRVALLMGQRRSKASRMWPPRSTGSSGVPGRPTYRWSSPPSSISS